MSRALFLVGVLFVTLANASHAQQPLSPGAAMLERLRGLAGEWEGTYVWTGARHDSGTMRVSYSLTGNGTAVVENLMTESTPSMTTIYHLDGADLRMTHFCGANNQPRLKATTIDEAQGIVQFSFVDATNLQVSPAHVDGFEIQLLPDDRLVLTFSFIGSGKSSLERIELKRVRTGR
jgi:hypothetical protein